MQPKSWKKIAATNGVHEHDIPSCRSADAPRRARRHTAGSRAGCVRRPAPPALTRGPDVREPAIVEAPSVLGLRPTGVEDLPAALLEAGLAEGLGAGRAGRVEPPVYDPARDPETGLLNPGGIAAYSVALADAVGGVLDPGRFPVVLGGDCSVLLGTPARTAPPPGRHGLLFLDGHTDFYQPSAEPAGEVASMELALATGRGRGRAGRPGRPGPAACGTRTSSPWGSGTRRSPRRPGCSRCRRRCTRWTWTRVRALGAAEAARRAVGVLTGDGRRARDGRRVLGPPRRRRPGRRDHAGRRLPAAGRADLAGAGDRPAHGADRRGAGGLRRHDLQPRLDPDGSIAARLTECVVSAFRD